MIEEIPLQKAYCTCGWSVYSIGKEAATCRAKHHKLTSDCEREINIKRVTKTPDQLKEEKSEEYLKNNLPMWENLLK